jgi:hypothetical protein
MASNGTKKSNGNGVSLEQKLNDFAIRCATEEQARLNSIVQKHRFKFDIWKYVVTPVAVLGMVVVAAAFLYKDDATRRFDKWKAEYEQSEKAGELSSMVAYDQELEKVLANYPASVFGESIRLKPKVEAYHDKVHKNITSILSGYRDTMKTNIMIADYYADSTTILSSAQWKEVSQVIDNNKARLETNAALMRNYGVIK